MLTVEEMIANLNDSKHLPFQIVEWKELSGGTSSSLWKLMGNDDKNYVLKINERDVIREESLFLTTYKSVNMLPEVVFVDEEFEFYIYTYIEGEVKAVLSNKMDNLSMLAKELITKYQLLPHDKWGWTKDLSNDWNQFLLSEIDWAKDVNSIVLHEEDFDLVRLLCQKGERQNGAEAAYLLHGDCGVHNFLQQDGNLVSVIDPWPLAGPPLYDLVFAFCSSPEQLTWEVIYEAACALPNFDKNKANLVEEVIVGLYIRIARCIYHHPDDLPAYLKAWKEWKMLWEKEIG